VGPRQNQDRSSQLFTPRQLQFNPVPRLPRLLGRSPFPPALARTGGGVPHKECESECSNVIPVKDDLGGKRNRQRDEGPANDFDARGHRYFLLQQSRRATYNWCFLVCRPENRSNSPSIGRWRTLLLSFGPERQRGRTCAHERTNRRRLGGGLQSVLRRRVEATAAPLLGLPGALRTLATIGDTDGT
jgi:hypothetical protein